MSGCDETYEAQVDREIKLRDKLQLELRDAIAELDKQKALIDQLGKALVKLWGDYEPKDYKAFYALREGLFAYQKFMGIDPDLPPVSVSPRNPFTDEITIEGVVYPCDFFRNKGRENAR